MCYGFGSILNTTINANGNSVTFRSSTFGPWGGCNTLGGFSPGCFGFGYNPMCGDSFGFGAGVGLGFACGAILLPAIPGIIKGAGKVIGWGFNNLVKPAAQFLGKCGTFAWNNVVKPVGNFIWDKALKPVGNLIWSGIKAVGNGIKSLWNKITGKD